MSFDYIKKVILTIIEEEIKEKSQHEIIVEPMKKCITMYLPNYSKSNRPSFEQSDLNKFLSWISHKIQNEEIENNQIHVICHKKLMKNFLKKNHPKLFDTYQHTFDTHHGWSITGNIGGKNITISRHGFSVANGLKLKGQCSKSVDEIDAKLSIWGIITMLLLRKSSIHVSHVYVSPLIRAWMTAILLYLGTSKNLIVEVAPYIIEDDIGKNNLTDTEHEQMKNIKHFLNFITGVLVEILITEINQLKEKNKLRILNTLVSNLNNMKRCKLVIQYNNVYTYIFKTNQWSCIKTYKKKENNYIILSDSNITNCEIKKGYVKPVADLFDATLEPFQNNNIKQIWNVKKYTFKNKQKNKKQTIRSK
jgi:hypothetical protein